MGLRKGLGLILGLGCLLPLWLAVYDFYRENEDRRRELNLDGGGEKFAAAAEEFIALGAEGERKLLSIVRAERLHSALRIKAAVALATGPGERGRKLREKLAGPQAGPPDLESVSAVSEIFDPPSVVSEACAGAGAGEGADSGDGEKPPRPLIDSLAENLSLDPQAQVVDVSEPDPDGKRRVLITRSPEPLAR